MLEIVDCELKIRIHYSANQIILILIHFWLT